MRLRWIQHYHLNNIHVEKPFSPGAAFLHNLPHNLIWHHSSHPPPAGKHQTCRVIFFHQANFSGVHIKEGL